MTKVANLTTPVRQLLASATQRLTAAGCDTPRLDAEILLAHLLDRDRSWLYLQPDAALTLEQQSGYLDLIARREQRQPVAYLTGHKEFFGLDFLVTPHTLIPRPETELLIETALTFVHSYHQLDQPINQTSHLQPSNPPEQLTMSDKQLTNPTFQPSNLPTLQPSNPPFTIVDVGTGSGCIAVTLAKLLPLVQLIATDLSGEALTVARQNAEDQAVADRIKFYQTDLLAPLTEPVNMIVSNPPYLRSTDLASPHTAPEVHRHEPRLALDGGGDGLKIIRRLLDQAQKLLAPGGCLLVEIGFDQGEAVKSLTQTQFPGAQIEIKKDLAGLDRLLVATP
ncbi:MAG TPA: HemK/PrmC family methyltransferase [Anaerolineae bacterium]|nr:HemK/PrmC family methyltransferase [Anaerolineae bacterium]HMR64924.1 HemK/PrmC family methyltransferase [Anaerolineae bacterium]